MKDGKRQWLPEAAGVGKKLKLGKEQRDPRERKSPPAAEDFYGRHKKNYEP